jgi:hypothetical protein
VDTENGRFKGTTIKEIRKQEPINCGQSFRSLANNVQSKLVTPVSANTQ